MLRADGSYRELKYDTRTVLHRAHLWQQIKDCGPHHNYGHFVTKLMLKELARERMERKFYEDDEPTEPQRGHTYRGS